MRYYAESDGEIGARTYYVIDTDADPLSGGYRQDCHSWGEAAELAKRLNFGTYVLDSLDKRKGVSYYPGHGGHRDDQSYQVGIRCFAADSAMV